MKKLLFILSCCLFTCSFIFAQESEIELPDLTTIVEGENSDVEIIEAPDFSDVVLLPSETGKLVPVLPEIEIIEGKDIVEETSSESEKKIYAEGKIGGGYPACFIGDFSVSKIFGDNPFKISFYNYSSSGYAGSKRAEGYYNNDTSIMLDKKFTFNNITLNLSGNYEELVNGFQGKVESISSSKQDTICGNADFNWDLPYGFNISSQLFSDFYYRFPDITASSSDSFDCPDWIKRSLKFNIQPTVAARWENDSFSTGFTGVYSFFDYTNRGDFGLDFSWKNDYVKLFTTADFIIGDNINDNQFLIPFTLGVQAAIPVYFSDRKLGLSLEGGMESYQNTIEVLEKQYKFTALEKAPSETSNWYSSFALQLPLKSAFSAKVGVDYKTTAFNNGVWQPVFDDSSLNYGYYGYAMKNSESLASSLNITYRYKLFAVTAGWTSNWMDVPALENKHTLKLIGSLQSKEGKWGTSVEGSYSIDAADKTPFINFEAYLQASNSVKFVLSAEDIVKLVSAKSRTYAGNYISDSGNVTLAVKFLF